MAIGRMTMALKDAAIECGIPIILLAQLSRGVERENREPMLSDLRESGNIEQDSDRVIFLDAPTVTVGGVHISDDTGSRRKAAEASTNHTAIAASKRPAMRASSVTPDSLMTLRILVESIRTKPISR